MEKNFIKSFVVLYKYIILINLLLINGCVSSSYEFYAPSSWPTYSKSEEQIKKYYNENRSTLDKIEGIWDLGYNYTITSYVGTDKGTNTRAYQVAIVKKDFTDKSEFVAICLASGSNNSAWSYGKVKAKFVKTANPNIYQGIYYTMEFQEIGCYYEYVNEGSINATVNYNALIDSRMAVTEDIMMLKTYPLTTTVETPIITGTNGTGFLFDKQGLIITCAHVVDGYKNIKVRAMINNTEKTFSASTNSIDQNNDIAILKIDLSSYQNEFNDIPIVISNDVREVGEKVYALGYPLPGTMGEDLKLTDGIISSSKGFQNNINYFQVSCPVQPGNSGGPLLDDEGYVIGLINAKHKNTENVGYALKSTVLNNMIKLSLSNNQNENINTLKEKTLTERYKILKNYIFIIEAE